MSDQFNVVKIIWMLLLIELAAAATVLHRRTEIDANGDKRTKTWTTQEADDNFPTAGQDAADEGFQTFTRNGITLRIKPSTTTLRIGGKNMSPDQLLEQAKYTKDLELVAVRQLLSTGHPVKRTNIENGRKHISTYELQPDGSILYRKVEDIDKADVDRRFEEILKQSMPQQPKKLGGDWEWAKDDVESNEDGQVPPPKQQPTPASKSTPQASVEANSTPAAKQPTKPPQATGKPNVPTWQPLAADVQRDFLGPPTTFGQYPKLPSSWNREPWPNTDPFNPPELPTLDGFNTEDFDYAPHEAHTAPNPQTNTFTSTTTDKDGNLVRTTYTSGPNEWKRKTVKISTNEQPTETTEESTTIQTRTIPNLDEFLKTQYTSGNHAKPASSTPATSTTSTTPKTIKTINIADLPPVAVFNINRPIEEQYLQPLGPNAAAERPIKTLQVENISPSPDPTEQHVERTKIHTITKTLHSNQTPTSANLDPNMLDILQRAGIKPEEITQTNGQSITRTRIEPDGRIVKTTYRVSPTYDANSFNLPAQPNFGVPFNERPFGARHPYVRPSIFSQPFPSAKHHSASHFGIDFTPFAALPPLDEPTSTFNPKTLVRDREPLGTDDEVEDVEVSTLNPLLIHPLDEPASAPAATNKHQVKHFVSKRAKSEIAEFLTQLIKSLDDWNGQKGEFLKTVVDDDGRALTAKFVLAFQYDSL